MTAGTIVEATELAVPRIRDEDDAWASIGRARAHVGGFWAEVREQIDSRAWEFTDYADFEALWAGEYEALQVAIPRGERPQLVGSLRGIGQTQQQIADKLGVSDKTIERDVASIRQMSDSEAESTKITNARGQERPAHYKSSWQCVRCRRSFRRQDQQPHADGLCRDCEQAKIDAELDERIAQLPNDLAERVDSGAVTLSYAESVHREQQERLRAWADKVDQALTTIGRMIGYPIPDGLACYLSEPRRVALAEILARCEGVVIDDL